MNLVMMHKNGLDCALDIRQLRKNKDGIVTAYCHWINLGYTGNPWIVDGKYHLYVLELNDWVDITSKVNNKRTSPGLPK